MRIAIAAAAAAAAFLVVSPSSANEPATPSPAKAAKEKRPVEDPNRVVCKREHVVGSNRPQKICMTVAERQRIKDASDRLMDSTGQTNREADSVPGAR